ncbi:nucleotidyltransferase domain-containing protein [Clostridium beijerinckii]|nr:nucleotidyltransferase domain-containing protein [Clostridium beijerinckii]
MKNYFALALFGSYNTDQWIRNKSDIDILMITIKEIV